jgi:hypothetical protein
VVGVRAAGRGPIWPAWWACGTTGRGRPPAIPRPSGRDSNHQVVTRAENFFSPGTESSHPRAPVRRGVFSRRARRLLRSFSPARGRCTCISEPAEFVCGFVLILLLTGRL